MKREGRTALVVAAFLASWGLLQWMGRALAGRTDALALALFMVLYIAVAGILLPLMVGGRAGLRLHEPMRGWKPWVGALFAVVALAAGLLGSGVLERLSETWPGWLTVLKYLLLFLPMSLAVCLVCFWLVPQMVVKGLGSGLWGTLAAVAAGGAVSLIGFWVDGLFGDLETALILGILGLFFTAAAILTGSFWKVYPVFALLMLANTLAEGKYHGVSWWALVIGFVAALTAFIIGMHHGRAGERRGDETAG